MNLSLSWQRSLDGYGKNGCSTALLAVVTPAILNRVPFGRRKGCSMTRLNTAATIPGAIAAAAPCMKLCRGLVTGARQGSEVGIHLTQPRNRRWRKIWICENQQAVGARFSRSPMRLGARLEKALSGYAGAAVAAGVSLLALSPPAGARIVHTPANTLIPAKMAGQCSLYLNATMALFISSFPNRFSSLDDGQPVELESKTEGSEE